MDHEIFAVEVEGKQRLAKPLVSEAMIRERIMILAEALHRDLKGIDTLYVLVVLHGAMIFAADLIRALNLPVKISSVRVKSYLGESRNGVTELVTPLSSDLKGQTVLVLEDIVDTGHTIHFLKKELDDFGVKNAQFCTLLSKPECHEVPVHLDYVGFQIGKNFVIGYGLDVGGHYRYLPFIAEVLP